jgi:hypothetical protein
VSSAPTVLILACDAATADDVGIVVRACQCISVFPLDDETASAALFRVRPSVALIEVGRPELNGQRVLDVAAALGAGLVLFGGDPTDMRNWSDRLDLPAISLEEPIQAIGFTLTEAARL